MYLSNRILFSLRKSQEAQPGGQGLRSFHLAFLAPLALGDDAADSLTGAGSSGSFVSSEDGSTVPPTLPWGPSGLSVWHALGISGQYW